MLAAEASGKTVQPVVSQRTLFGIPSTVEQTIERIVSEDEEERRKKRQINTLKASCNMPDELLDKALQEAKAAGLNLLCDEDGIALSDETMTLHGDFTRMIPRLKPNRLNHELLVKAARIKGEHSSLSAIDATAGLGEDSLLLAAAGFTVTLFERNAVIAVLLQSAIEKACHNPELAEPASRMNLIAGNSIEALQTKNYSADIVLLDPMFPQRQKSAAVKKKLQLLQHLEQPCEDEEVLFEAALLTHPRKVIVKRPAKGPLLAERTPSYSLSGKAVRFDCYALGDHRKID